jgi:hypothetical protein
MLIVAIAASTMMAPAKISLELPHVHRGIAIIKPAPCESFLVVVKEAGESWVNSLEPTPLSADEIFRSSVLFYLGFEDHTYSVSIDRWEQKVKGGESQSFDSVVNGPKEDTVMALNGFGLHEAY